MPSLKFKRLFKSKSATRSRSSSKTSNNTSTNPNSKNGMTPPIDYNDPPLTPLSLKGYATTTRNRLLSAELGEEIRGLLPSRLQISGDWHLLYSMEQHGASLSTLYRQVKPTESSFNRNGYVIVIHDRNGGIFGAFTNEFLHPTDSHRYYGNGQCFLWKCKEIQDDDEETSLQFQGFPYTGLNDYIIYCTSEFLSMGGGDGHYGLWIDKDLLTGTTNRSLTFGNEILSNEGDKFGILGIEVWRVG